MNAEVFVSYRRADTQGWAGRLAEGLAREFGARPVFLDLESIKPGADFAAVIDERLACARVVLALIGPHWLSAALPGGRRRLDDPEDFVRREIAAVLQRDVVLIPVLLGGAAVPHGSELPAELAGLAGRQALELTDKRWDYDFEQLAKAIEAAGLPRTAKDEVPRAGVSVGTGATFERVEAGNVTAFDVEGELPPLAVDRPIDVLGGSTVKDSKLGDLSAITLRRSGKDAKR